MGIPTSVSSASLPRIREYPFGITVRYSYQKSNMSPKIKISFARGLISERNATSFFSLMRLTSAFGVPRWKSDKKYIFRSVAINVRKNRDKNIGLMRARPPKRDKPLLARERQRPGFFRYLQSGWGRS